MCAKIFSNLKFWKISDFEKFEIPENFEEKIIIKKFEIFEIFLDQNIFKNISQIQLNENGPKVGPAPRVILVY